MKPLVVGGAGNMASRAVRELAAEPDVTVAAVADYKLEAALLGSFSLRESVEPSTPALWPAVHPGSRAS